MRRYASIHELAKRISGKAVGSGTEESTVSSVTASSQHALPESVFVAVQGVKHDGHKFIGEAFQSGSVLAVVEREDALEGRLGIVVKDSRCALSILADYFAGSPSQKLSVVGITGTNGKTTTHWLVAELLQQFHKNTLRLGTLGIFAPGIIDLPGALTTPDPIKLHETFRSALEGGCEYGVMEVSSHALDQLRVENIHFDVGVFTNLTRDHLDYHGEMEKYAEAKKHLFYLLGSKGKGRKAAIINSDDPNGELFAAAARSAGCNTICFGENDEADVRITGFSQSIAGSFFRLLLKDSTAIEVKSSFIGRYNASNLTAALLAVSQLGYDLKVLAASAPALSQVPGRLESCGDGHVGVYVDYAHTPDALENALKALRELTDGKLWVLFGCGGDRDRGKRPQMALVAAQYADEVVVTSDNPRTESPDRIISDILESGITPRIVSVDREKAIIETLSLAEDGDVVLVAGKGHENYQIIGTTKIHFSDTEIVRDFFQRKV